MAYTVSAAQEFQCNGMAYNLLISSRLAYKQYCKQASWNINIVLRDIPQDPRTKVSHMTKGTKFSGPGSKLEDVPQDQRTKGPKFFSSRSGDFGPGSKLEDVPQDQRTKGPKFSRSGDFGFGTNPARPGPKNFGPLVLCSLGTSSSLLPDQSQQTWTKQLWSFGCLVPRDISIFCPDQSLQTWTKKLWPFGPLVPRTLRMVGR